MNVERSETIDELAEELETFIDANELWRVLEALAQVAAGKADHLRANWGDDVSAKCWSRCVGAINAAASRACKQGV